MWQRLHFCGAFCGPLPTVPIFFQRWVHQRVGEGHPTGLGMGITPQDWCLRWGLGHPVSLETALGAGLLAGLSTAQGWSHTRSLGMESPHGVGDGPGDGVTPQMSQQVCGHGYHSAANQSPHRESCSAESSASTWSHSRCLSAGPAQSLRFAGGCPGSLKLGWAGGGVGPSPMMPKGSGACAGGTTCPGTFVLCCAQQPLPQGCCCPGLGQPGGEPMVTQGQGRCHSLSVPAGTFSCHWAGLMLPLWVCWGAPTCEWLTL